MSQSAVIRFWAGVLTAALVPVVLVTVGGGADLDFGPFRLSFWGWQGPMIALLGAMVMCFLGPWAVDGGRQKFGGWAALACFSWVAFRMWTGGDHGPRMVLFAQAGLGILLVTSLSLRRRSAVFPQTAWKGLIGGLATGCMICLGVVAADRNDLRSRVEIGPANDGRRDVILLVIDALRADALGFYGAQPSPSPFLDDLVSTGVVFDRAFSQAPWTVPSVASLMSSLYPTTVRPEKKGDQWKIEAGNLVRPLPEDIPWLPTRFREAGYHTVGLVKNEWLSERSGFDRDFDVFENVGGDAADGQSARQLVDAVRRWSQVFVKAKAGGRVNRFFLYLHFMDPHIPYRPPDAYRPKAGPSYEGPLDGTAGSLKRYLQRGDTPTEADRQHLRALYRGEIAYLDTELRRLHQILSEAGLWDPDTIVAFVADHGEQFGEHGSFQHGDIFRENVNVPLVFLGPGLPPARIVTPVPLIDVAPTLLDLADLENPGFREGRSLVPTLRGQFRPQRPVFTEHGRNRRVTGATHSVLLRRRKATVFSVEDDLEEVGLTTDEAPESLDLLAWLADHEARTIPSFSNAAPVEIDPDALKELRELGYIE